MKTITLTDEELVSMSYDDVAYLILEKNQRKMKICVKKNCLWIMWITFFACG